MPLPDEDGVVHQHDEHFEKLPFSMQIANLIAVFLPPVCLVIGMLLLWGSGFTLTHLILMTLMYLFTGYGITVGYHRYFTHKSFEAPGWVKNGLAILGSMAAEGPLLRWVAQHRQHHQHSDKHDDPHSPHLHGGGVWALMKGLWHAHAGWMFKPDAPNLHRYVVDLANDRSLVWISRLFPVWVGLGLAIPAVIGGLLTMSWAGVLLGLVWGGIIRIGVVHHITWSVNSICHVWGTQPFRTHDHSKNNGIVGVLALGEGWHNNHHAFPTSARHGLRWWEFDSSYIIIWVMEKLGMARKVRVPTNEMMEAKRADRTSRTIAVQPEYAAVMAAAAGDTAGRP